MTSSWAAQEVEEAVEFMAAVRVAFPEVARSVRTSQVAHAVLAHKAHLVEQVAHSGAPPHPPWALWHPLPRRPNASARSSLDYTRPRAVPACCTSPSGPACCAGHQSGAAPVSETGTQVARLFV